MRATLLLSAILLTGGLVLSCPKAPSPGQESPEALVACLGDDSPDSRDDAEERIVTLGALAEPVLREALLSKDPEIAARATGILQRLADSRKYPEWIASLPEASIQTGSFRGTRSTRIEDGHLVLDDSPSSGQGLTLVCEPTIPFRLISARCGKLDAKAGPWAGEVVEGQLRVPFAWPGLNPIEVDVSNVAIDAVLLRLLPLLPQRIGEIREYEAFFVPATLKRYGHCAVEYVGEEEIEVEGEHVMSHTWELSAWGLCARTYRVVGKRVVRMEINIGSVQVDFTPVEAK